MNEQRKIGEVTYKGLNNKSMLTYQIEEEVITRQYVDVIISSWSGNMHCNKCHEAYGCDHVKAVARYLSHEDFSNPARSFEADTDIPPTYQDKP